MGGRARVLVHCPPFRRSPSLFLLGKCTVLFHGPRPARPTARPADGRLRSTPRPSFPLPLKPSKSGPCSQTRPPPSRAPPPTTADRTRARPRRRRGWGRAPRRRGGQAQRVPDQRLRVVAGGAQVARRVRGPGERVGRRRVPRERRDGRGWEPDVEHGHRRRVERQARHVPRVLPVPGQAQQRGVVRRRGLVDDGRVLLVAQVEDAHRAVGRDRREDADAAPRDVEDLAVVRDQLPEEGEAGVGVWVCVPSPLFLFPLPPAPACRRPPAPRPKWCTSCLSTPCPACAGRRRSSRTTSARAILARGAVAREHGDQGGRVALEPPHAHTITRRREQIRRPEPPVGVERDARRGVRGARRDEFRGPATKPPASSSRVTMSMRLASLRGRSRPRGGTVCRGGSGKRKGAKGFPGSTGLRPASGGPNLSPAASPLHPTHSPRQCISGVRRLPRVDCRSSPPLGRALSRRPRRRRPPWCGGGARDARGGRCGKTAAPGSCARPSAATAGAPAHSRRREGAQRAPDEKGGQPPPRWRRRRLGDLGAGAGRAPFDPKCAGTLPFSAASPPRRPCPGGRCSPSVAPRAGHRLRGRRRATCGGAARRPPPANPRGRAAACGRRRPPS